MVGRKSEIQEMQNLLNSPKAEFLAMYGRRRVGKTYLIKNVYKDHLSFELQGLKMRL